MKWEGRKCCSAEITNPLVSYHFLSFSINLAMFTVFFLFFSFFLIRSSVLLMFHFDRSVLFYFLVLTDRTKARSFYSFA